MERVHNITTLTHQSFNKGPKHEGHGTKRATKHVTSNTLDLNTATILQGASNTIYDMNRTNVQQESKTLQNYLT